MADAEPVPEPDPLIVFVAENQRVADAVVALLANEGIATEVRVPPIETSSEPLTGASEVVFKNTELEIRAETEAKATAAKAVIVSELGKGALHAVREKRAARTGTVTATCEDCGKPSDWPAQLMGTTEVCPHCGGYMDIPDPDEDWSGMDFGAEEDEDGEGTK